MGHRADSSVLRQLADPVLYQVVPHASSQSHAIVNAPVCGIARSIYGKDILNAGRSVLDEDAYTEALGAVIERDFYPDLGRLQQQLTWLDALDSGDNTRIENARESIAESVRRVDRLAVESTPAAAPAWRGGATPARQGLASVQASNTTMHAVGNDDSASHTSWSADLRAHGARSRTSALDARSVGRLTVGASTGTSAGKSLLNRLGVDAFQSTFVSEDTATFSANLAAHTAERALAHWWTRTAVGSREWQLMMTDGNARRAAGEAGTLLLRDANLTGSDAFKDTGLGVTVKGRVKTWRYRPRNALFFTPLLHVSNDISMVHKPKPHPDLPVALLQDGYGRDSASGQIGPGSAFAVGLAQDVTAAEGRGESVALVRDKEYSADDLDTGRYRSAFASAGASTTGSAVAGLDLALPSFLHAGQRVRADGGIAMPAAIQHSRTRFKGSMLLKNLGTLESAGDDRPAVYDEFRGYRMVATPRIVAGTRLDAQSGSLVGHAELDTRRGEDVLVLDPPWTWGQIAGPPVLLDPMVGGQSRPSLTDSVPSTSSASASQLAAAFGVSQTDVSMSMSANSAQFRVGPVRAREATRDAILERVRDRMGGAAEKRKRDIEGVVGAGTVMTGIAAREALRAALTATREGVLGQGMRQRTPVFAAASTPSVLAGGHDQYMGSGRSIASRAPSAHASGMSRSAVTAAHARFGASAGSVRAAIASMTPAAQRIARQVAGQVSAARGSAGLAGGDLAGAFGFR